MLTYLDYRPGHPWFYKLGGKRLSLKAIREAVKSGDYKGYLATDIAKADRMAEPKRTAVLRAILDKARQDLTADIARYRECAFELAQHRREHERIDDNGCADVFVNISLKHNHIYNGFAHLHTLEHLISRQPSLFDF